MITLKQHLPRLVAASAFAAAAMSAVVVTEANTAGAPTTGILSAAPQQADAHDLRVAYDHPWHHRHWHPGYWHHGYWAYGHWHRAYWHPGYWY